MTVGPEHAIDPRATAVSPATPPARLEAMVPPPQPLTVRPSAVTRNPWAWTGCSTSIGHTSNGPTVTVVPS